MANALPLTLALELPELPPIAEIGLPLLGVLLITMGMLMGIRKKRRRPGANVTAREQVDELRQKQAVRGDLEQLMIEVEQLAKRFGTQLDAKTMQMERLIDEANEKIAELKQLHTARHAADTFKDTQPPQAPTATPHPAPNQPPATSHQPPVPDPEDELKQQVAHLADLGHDPVEIARQLDEHVGKIELILALRKA